MKLQELLPFLAKNQNEFKVHCATPNGENNPLSIWLSGQNNFTKDQNIQTKKNFERKYILSFCEINKNGEWLFVGIYKSFGVKEIIKDKNTGKELNIYDTELIEEGKEFIGKLVVGFDLKEESPSAARQRYRYLESLLDKMEVLELKREKVKVEFPGYDKVNISWKDLENVIEDDAQPRPDFTLGKSVKKDCLYQLLFTIRQQRQGGFQPVHYDRIDNGFCNVHRFISDKVQRIPLAVRKSVER